MSFADFPDEVPVVELLRRGLDRGRLPHAYLFVGPDLSGLESMAAALAQTLNCQNPPRRGSSQVPLDCCDACLPCRKIRGSNHPDVQWVRPESKSRSIRIEQMLEVMQTVHLKPTEAVYKFVMVVAADRLTTQAANAFLKTLEEPPPNSILILLSTEPERVLETIVSRCHRLNFSQNASIHLTESRTAQLKTFAELAASDQKGLLGRYRLLGSLLAELGRMKEETEEALSGLSPLERYNDVDPKLKERWEDELAAAIEAEYRRKRGELLLGLQMWMRDVWFQTMTAGNDLMHFPVLGPACEAVAGRLSPADALENLATLEKLQRLLRTNVQEALALEVSLLKLRL